MDKLTEKWVNATKMAVKTLRQNYSQFRGMILTEGDLECHLYSELLKQKELSGYHSSKNDSYWPNGVQGSELKTSYVHSQATWFKLGKKSGFEVDITIGDPKKLEVINIELFEKYTSKGFAYDGECVAIELKFIRNIDRTATQATEDYLKLRDKLIPSMTYNIDKHKYKLSSPENIAFITIVGCKNEEIFKKARHYLGKHLGDSEKPCPENLFVILFFQDEILCNKNSFIEAYTNYKPE